MFEYGGDANAFSVLQGDSHSHSEDGDCSVNEVDVHHGSQSIDLPIDVFNTTTIGVTMTNSSHVQINPVTRIHGPVTIHQYPSSKNSGVRSLDQSECGYAVRRVSKNCAQEQNC